MTTSKIEWTEQVWNPIVGCTVHSAGCTNCYAMRMAHRLEAMADAGNDSLAHYQGTTRKVNGNPIWTGKLGFSEAALLAPLRRKKPTRWFVNSMSDLFHQDVPDEWIDRVFAVMALAPQHTFQVLTKRTARMREYMTSLDHFWHGNTDAFNERMATAFDANYWWPDNPEVGAGGILPWPLPNVWLGVSVEDQRAADERVPDLLATPAAVRWLSCEPLLGPVDLMAVKRWVPCNIPEYGGEGVELISCLRGSGSLNWIVVGGESGPGARDNDFIANARSLLRQCRAAGVPFFGKQGFRKQPLPEDLMVREFPA